MNIPGVGIDLHVSFWRGRMSLDETQLALKDKQEFQTIKKYLRLGSKYVVPPEAIEKVNAIESSARSLIHGGSVFTPVGHIMKPEVYEESCTELETTRERFMAAGAELAGTRDSLIGEMVPVYQKYANLAYPGEPGGLYFEKQAFVDAIIKKIPSADSIRKSFQFQWGPRPILSPSQIVSALEPLIRQNGAIQLSEQLLSRAFAMQETQVAETLRLCVTQPAELLLEGLKKINASIEQNDLVTNGRHLRSLGALVRTGQRLNIMNDPGLAALTAEMAQIVVPEMLSPQVITSLIGRLLPIVTPSLSRFAAIA